MHPELQVHGSAVLSRLVTQEGLSTGCVDSVRVLVYLLLKTFLILSFQNKCGGELEI